METVTFTSKALLANLQQTKVSKIKYDPKYDLLQIVFKDFPALKNQISFLLKEIFHPYRNNQLVLEDFRAFFLRNLTIILNSPYRERGLYFVFELLFNFFGSDKATNIKASEIYYSLLEKTVEILDEKSFHSLSPILKEILKAGAELPEEIFSNFLESYYSFKRLAKKLLKFSLDEEFIKILFGLLKRYYILIYDFWGQDGKLNIFDIELYKRKLIKEGLTLSELLDLPDHLDLLRGVKNYIQKICAEDEEVIPEEEKISILFNLIENPVLQLIHEELLKEINQILIKMIEKKPSEKLEDFLIKFFAILKEKKILYPRTAFECIKNTAISILNKRAVYLAEVLISEIIKYGFFPPQIEGIDERWRIKDNPHHLLNIKYWLEIFRVHPEWCSSLLSALHLNLRLYGLSIKDTDLFQREITALLNAPIRPIYNLVKQFCKIFPVYFNEIGAEGLIRDLSTEIDEMFQRKDTLLHFLRKFIHIENSSLAIDFIKDIFYFWFTLDGKYIKKYLPEPIWKRVVKDELFYHIPMQTLLIEIFKVFSKYKIEDLLETDIEVLTKTLSNISFDEQYKTKLLYLFKLYNLEKQKYFGYLTDLETFISQYKESGFDFIEDIPKVLKEKNEYKKLNTLLKWLEDLKEKYILSERKFEPIEEIIIKRHIAVDIPSMYGKYKEKKFDALGLTYRLEYIVDKIFAQLINDFKIDFLTKNQFYKILKTLKAFKRALEIDGISSKKFNLYLDLLESSLKSYPLSFDQYLDIFKGLIDGVQHIIKSYYINPYLNVFPVVYEVLKEEALIEKYKKGIINKQDVEKYYCLSEMVLRDILNSGFIILYLDQFLKKVYQALIKCKEEVNSEDLNVLLTFDWRKSISFLYKPNILANDLIYLGSKAFNLIQLSNLLPEPLKIPPGFVLTTEIFRCYKFFKKYPSLWKEYENVILEAIKALEEKTGKKFGDKYNPLLLSVRSGAAISMPGMMTSILNVGINPEIAEGLAEKTQNIWFAWDTYRRFIQNWAMSLGVPRDFFNRLMREHKRKYGVKLKREFTGSEMRELALLYRKEIEKLGIHIIDDPWEQLFKSIEFILNSWYHKKAVYYREIMEIAEEWGTAVIIQEMVFGNMGPKSGTGVTFTTSPHGKFPRILLWGDYTPYNQGEDIVSGLVNAYPISIEQKRLENREGPSLEEAFPQIYEALLKLAYKLVYEEGWDHQEIEFTFQSEKPEDLYILQVRDIILREEKILPSFQKRSLENLIYLGRGIGVSGSILSGRVVFNLEDILKLKAEGEPLILLRYDTVPDNIKEISMVDGILTARGGQTSHAAIVASRLGKVCVVGCEELRIDEIEKFAKLKNEVIKLGEWITLNGITGDIYKGKIQNKGGAYEVRN
ncbi:MAG: PEP/pyruvate-binding domain-containing protein [Caldimicrobium sp.]